MFFQHLSDPMEFGTCFARIEVCGLVRVLCELFPLSRASLIVGMGSRSWTMGALGP